MSKDLEKEYLEDLDHYDEGIGIHSSSYQKCKERLVRLAKIDNSIPSEAITELANIKNTLLSIDLYSKVFINDDLFESLENIKQALLKSQEQEKVLEIIKKKEVQIVNFKASLRKENSLKYYNWLYNCCDNMQLTQEEFDLLKRWLGE